NYSSAPTNEPSTQYRGVLKIARVDDIGSNIKLVIGVRAFNYLITAGFVNDNYRVGPGHCATDVVVNNRTKFPNTNSTTQKQQNHRADRPDIRAKLSEQELLWGEITGPKQAGNKAKNLWDMFKLVRYGKAFIVAGNDSAPLVQVIGNLGTYMRLYIKVRGVMVLEEAGIFIIPTFKAMVPSFVATLPTLELLKINLRKMSRKTPSELKRSWGHQDVKGAKKRLISDTARCSKQ
ncbi:hypothetical protein BGZ76_002807, partial [Entomortierella beljakovae]